MAKLDRLIAQLDRQKASPDELKERAAKLLEGLRDELESEQPDLAEQMRPQFESLERALITLARALGRALGNLSDSLNDLRNIDNLGGEIDKTLQKVLSETFEPFQERVLQILQAARAAEADVPGAETWQFDVERDAEGKIARVFASRQSTVDERLETLDEILPH